jgi:hypothetical protein
VTVSVVVVVTFIAIVYLFLPPHHRACMRVDWFQPNAFCSFFSVTSPLPAFPPFVSHPTTHSLRKSEFSGVVVERIHRAPQRTSALTH